MIIRLLFVLVLSFLSPLLYCQEINGRIIDHLKRPVAFAHVFASNETGTITNDSGYFRLIIPVENDSLYVSAIGYKPWSAPIFSLNSTEENQIVLRQQVQILDNIIINGAAEGIDTAYYLVTKAVKNVYKNYPTSKYSFKAFYRETTVTDTVYSRISETMALVSSPGYKSNIENTKAQVLALRKSVDNRELNWRESLSEWLYKKNGLYRVLNHDRLRIKSKTENREYIENSSLGENIESRFFNDYFFDNTQFILKKTVPSGKDTIYQISYYPKKGLYQHHELAYGSINISKKDNAILEYTAFVLYDDEGNRENHLENKHDKEFDKCYICQVNKNRVINDSIYYYTHVKYKQHQDGKYYLNFVSSKSFSGTNSNVILHSDFSNHYKSLGKQSNIYIHNELYVTEILPYTKIKRSEVLDRGTEMHELKSKGVWNELNLPMVNPLNSKVKRDLMNGKTLFE